MSRAIGPNARGRCDGGAADFADASPLETALAVDGYREMAQAFGTGTCRRRATAGGLDLEAAFR